MAQAGMHSMIGVAVRKWTPARQWLVLGIVLGSLLPDADNLAVAVATVTGSPTAGLHRTFTQAFTVTAVIMVFNSSLSSPNGRAWATWDWGWALA
ncbi:MAG: metal-dependent hydrolase [bacterium]|nr:metal-dependent hydrolase [bacterium]